MNRFTLITLLLSLCCILLSTMIPVCATPAENPPTPTKKTTPTASPSSAVDKARPGDSCTITCIVKEGRIKKSLVATEQTGTVTMDSPDVSRPKPVTKGAGAKADKSNKSNKRSDNIIIDASNAKIRNKMGIIVKFSEIKSGMTITARGKWRGKKFHASEITISSNDKK